MAFVAFVAALGFVLAGPSAVAVADAPPPVAGGSSSGKPRPWDWLNWKMHEALSKDAIHPHDKNFFWKNVVQVTGEGVVNLMRGGEKGKEGPSVRSAATEAVRGFNEVRMRMKKTPKGARKEVTAASDKIHEERTKADRAKTPKARMKAEKNVESARAWYKEAATNLSEVKKIKPRDTEAEIKKADTRIRNLEEKIAKLEEKKAGAGRKREQNRVQRHIDEARKRLTEAEEHRARLEDGPDGPDDTGGTRPVKPGPKNPSQGPGSTHATPPTTPLISNTTKNPPTATGNPPATTATKTLPKTRAATGVKLPRLVNTPGRANARGVAAEAVGDVVGLAIADYSERKNRELLDKALGDPALRKRLIDEHTEYHRMNPFEQMAWPVTGKEFTEGELHANAPKLVEVEKTLDTVKKKADRSNADPAYRQARVECGGYDTCVTERTRKLREKNRKDVAESTRKARKSNADPAYRQARVECGGYDTCVTERTRKLREENRKAIAESTRKARESNADPAYRRARVECGGYDTCVTERTRKLRAEQAKDHAGKSKRDRDDHRAQHSGKTSDGKNAVTTRGRGDRSDRGAHKDAKAGPAKSKHENRAV
ncbi:hypothetical protein ACGFMM_34485 [Streptomyces sp. NPDC048604]|uniref:hypothetical protein n=1 Tax=Streptomyces sp. NPDC048604 TaxID=3365578 RepID=UPI00371EDFB3